MEASESRLTSPYAHGFVAAPLARFGRTCWWGAVLVELKAVRAIDPSHIAQLLNYLRCTVLETGLILNFGPP